jgi:hypothetical protein
MAVPWLQIVQLVPSIVEVSRELLKRTKGATPAAAAPQSDDDLALRIIALEENERRQAELVSQMAEQLAGLTRAITALHQRMLWLSAACAVSVLAAIIAIALVVSRGS